MKRNIFIKSIMFNKNKTKFIAVQSFGGRWGFPKGKLEVDYTNGTILESYEECAIREVREETGLDIRDKLNPRLYREYFHDNEVHMIMYIILDVDESVMFKALTKSEIKNIKWINVAKNTLKSNVNDIITDILNDDNFLLM